MKFRNERVKVWMKKVFQNLHRPSVVETYQDKMTEWKAKLAYIVTSLVKDGIWNKTNRLNV